MRRRWAARSERFEHAAGGRDATRLAVAGIVAAALAVAAAGFVPTFRALEREADANASSSPQERRLAGAYAVDISRDLLLAAKRRIGPGQTFAVVTGPRVKVSTPITLTALPAYAEFWLLPNRAVDDPGAADWVLCYGCALSGLDVRTRVVWSSGSVALAAVQG